MFSEAWIDLICGSDIPDKEFLRAASIEPFEIPIAAGPEGTEPSLARMSLKDMGRDSLERYASHLERVSKMAEAGLAAKNKELKVAVCTAEHYKKLLNTSFVAGALVVASVAFVVGAIFFS